MGNYPLAARFAENLRVVRARAKLSQEDVAFRAGIHRTQISLLERGDRLPRVETLVKLAGALEITPNDLLDGIAFKPPPVIRVGEFQIDDGEQDRG